MIAWRAIRFAASASWRSWACAQGRDVEQIQRAVDAPHRIDPRSGRLDGVLPEGELVELPDAIPAALAKRVEELERFDEVH